MTLDAAALPDTPRLRVVVADDHARLRATLRAELTEAGFEVCGEAATAEEAIQAARRESPDLCLLDISMPGDGMHAAAEITRLVPRARVVMLTTSTSEQHVLDAVRAGAAGYLLKDDDPTRLPIALRDVMADVPAFPRRLTRPLLAVARDALGAPEVAFE